LKQPILFINIFIPGALLGGLSLEIRRS